jgi:hypothetical protein
MKKLYEFKVTVNTEVEKTEVKNENGQEITVKSKVNEPVEYNIVLKTPARKETDNFRLFYGGQIKRAIDAGLMTKAVLVNKHIDGAGALLSKETAKRIAELTLLIEQIRTSIVGLGAVGDGDVEKTTLQTELLGKLVDAQRELQAIENSNQVIFQNTAESYAQERSNLWLIFNQTYVEKDGAINPMFKGNNFDEKEESYFNLEENGDKVYVAARDKLALYWGLYSVGRISTKEDFEELEKQFVSTKG